MTPTIYHPSDDLCSYDRAWVQSTDYQGNLCKRCGHFKAAPAFLGLGTTPQSHYAFAVLGRNVVEVISADLHGRLERCGAIAVSKSVACVPIRVGGRRADYWAVIRTAFDDSAAVRGTDQGIFSFCPACGARDYSVVGGDVLLASEPELISTPIFFAASGGLVVDRDGATPLKEVVELLRGCKPPVRSRRVRLVSEPEDGL